MCIVLISNKHPSYPLILASNRDEYLSRPTLAADFWEPPNENVLGGRDLFRSVKGTWLGVTRDGRLAVLTNFREDTPLAENAVSRGEMVNAYLTAEKSDVSDTEMFVKRLIRGEAARGSGGFSLVCGKIGEPLAVVSNRMQNEDEVKWIGKGGDKETVGLSNAAFGDHTWPKVVDGENKLTDLIRQWTEHDTGREEMTRSLFDLLSLDALPTPVEGQGWETTVKSLRKSIFIRRIEADEPSAETIATAQDDAKIARQKATSGAYGTQKQTIILVDTKGVLYFSEKTLYDSSGKPPSSDSEGTRTFEFRIS